MINYRFTQFDEETAVAIRLEMLKIVNSLPPEHEFDGEFTEAVREYFRSGDQSTVLAEDCGKAVGCATLCYITLMPTYSHPIGRRAHLMNVYTNENYRRQGIAREMVEMLIRQARQRGVTEISLDATEEGKPLYEALGFKMSGEAMTLLL